MTRVFPILWDSLSCDPIAISLLFTIEKSFLSFLITDIFFGASSTRRQGGNVKLFQSVEMPWARWFCYTYTVSARAHVYLLFVLSRVSTMRKKKKCCQNNLLSSHQYFSIIFLSGQRLCRSIGRILWVLRYISIPFEHSIFIFISIEIKPIIRIHKHLNCLGLRLSVPNKDEKNSTTLFQLLFYLSAKLKVMLALWTHWKSMEAFRTCTDCPLWATERKSIIHKWRALAIMRLEQNWVKIAKNSSWYTKSGAARITREKVKLMEMFTFSLKFYEANTSNGCKMDMGKLNSVYWHSSTYDCQFFFARRKKHRDSFLSRSHSYLYGRSILFRYDFFASAICNFAVSLHSTWNVDQIDHL